MKPQMIAFILCST